MTEQLQQAVAQLEKLPEAAQVEIATRIQAIVEEMMEQRWDDLFADPRSQLFFDQMAERYEQAKRDDLFRSLPSASEEG